MRRERGLTQEQLAHILNVSVAAVSKWESGNNRPDLEILPNLAEVFQVSIDSLFGYEKTYKNIDRTVDEIQKLHEQEKYKEAIEKLKNVLLSYPNDFQINKLLADSYYAICFSTEEERLSCIEKAVYYYERSIELFETKYSDITTEEMLEVQIATLYAMEEAGRYEEAISLLRKYNTGGKYDNLIAQYMFYAGRREEAKRIVLHHCIANQIFVFNDLSALAAMYEKEKDYETAILFLETQIKTFELFMTEEGNYADRAYAGKAYIISKLYRKIENHEMEIYWREKAMEHAEKYRKHPSMKIDSLRFCDGVEGRMIDSYGEMIEELADCR